MQVGGWDQKGRDSNLMINLREIINKYVGIPHKLGSWDKEEGLDCLSLIYYIYKDFGIDLPLEFSEGFTIDNYKDLWEQNTLRSLKAKLKYVASLGKEIKSKTMCVGDIIITQMEDQIAMGIYVGQNLFISSFEDIGVALQNLENYELKRVYRWVLVVF